MKLEKIEGMNIPVGAPIELTFIEPSYIHKKSVYYIGIVKKEDKAGLKYSENKFEQHYREYFDDPAPLMNIKDIDDITILENKKIRKTPNKR